MKSIVKIISVLAIVGAISFTSCNSSDTKTISADSTKTEAMATHSSDHIYACPMHPEVTGKEGDTCPKCGMKLEHNDNAGAASNVKMKFTTNPATISPNEEVTLSMIPKLKDKDKELVALDVEHEKKIHLIVVSDDLSYFDHIHPEINADGSYTVKHKFPTGGKYTLFADYKPSGANHTVDNLTVNVTGNAPAAKKYSDDKLMANTDGFTVTLSPDGGRFATNSAMHISGAVTKDGKAIDPGTMENYLGAKAHMVVVSLDEKKYLHVHPGVENGKFDLHTTFEKPGVYRGWIQFQTDGKVHTADFVMNVAAGSDKKTASTE
jgi:rRNA maturation protein Nop10